MTRSTRILGLAAAVAIAIAFLIAATSLIASAQQARQASAEVKIDNFSFGPATITVPAGTEVTWMNRDDIPHTVVGNDKEFKSKVLDTGEKFSHTFTKAGAYSYFCSLHPKMTGKVVVE